MDDAGPRPDEIMSEQDIKDLFARFVKAWGDADFDGLAACVTPDFAWYLPVGPDQPHGKILRGPDAFKIEFAAREERGVDIQFDFDDLIIKGNTIISYYVINGTYTDGRRCSYRGVDIYEIRDRRIWSKDAYWKIISDTAVSGCVDLPVAT